MIFDREILVEGKRFKVIISDDQQALRSAYAEGRAVIGLWNRESADQCLSPARYAAESIDDIDPIFLERVVRRKEGLPWQIAATTRLTIREFVPADCSLIPDEPDGGEYGSVFLQESLLDNYIRCQYGFYEYGIWAVVRKDTGMLVGKAGICNLDLSGQEEFKKAVKNNDTPVELGYHIFSPYRRQGYGREACRAILDYGVGAVSDRIYARISPDNHPSAKLAEELGFRLIAQTRNGSVPRMCLYEWNCS